MSIENEFRLSVSKTKTFLDCKAKYKFSYIEKLPQKDREYHTFGKFCHKVLELFHLELMEGSQDPYNIIMGKSFKKAKEEFQEKMTTEMIKECFEIINKYLSGISLAKKNNLLPNVIACEKSFKLEILPNLILNGMIDRVQIDADDVIHVCDYKTSKNKKYLKNDFFQLLTYAYVMLMENSKIDKIRASYILMRHDFEYITTEFDINQIKDIREQYINYAEQILAEKVFEPNPTILCSWCDFLDLCPAGKSKAIGHHIYGEVNW